MRSLNKYHFQNKILAPSKACRLLARQSKSRRGLGFPRAHSPLVFTNGCFDILHPGHVTYLQMARNLGGSLIVAVNSDRSVRALKGDSRPINPLMDRVKVIAALECVTYVTWFEEDTPYDIIQSLSPDILVKGGDWKPKDIVGSAHVLSYGGKVKSLRFVDGKSSTNIIEKINATHQTR